MQIKITQIKTSKGFNPREALDRAEVLALKLSMKALGQQESIIIRKGDIELINGLHRIAAAKALGWKTIEARPVSATDQEARILALVSNNFGKRLNHLELGRNISLILEGVKKYEGRGAVKQDLAMKLGISFSEVESCLATYRNLNPEARELSTYGVRKGVLRVERLREIRQLPPEKQVAVLRQVVDVKDASAADRLVTAFLAAQDQPASTESPDSASGTTRHNPIHPNRRVTETESYPSANEIVLASKLRLFKEIQFSATGLCPRCHEEIELPHAKVAFNPPLWRRDLQAILQSDSQELEEEEKVKAI